MAPWEGFEPPTNWLTANCSTTELPRNNMDKSFTIVRTASLVNSSVWAGKNKGEIVNLAI